MNSLIKQIQSIKSFRINSFVLDDDLFIFDFQNSKNTARSTSFEITRTQIVFLFVDEGNIDISKEASDEEMSCDGSKYLMLANPATDWILNLNLQPKTKVYGIGIAVARLHKMFVTPESEEHPEYMNSLENFQAKKFYSFKDYHAKVKQCINELVNYEVKGFASIVYKNGKVLEFLAYYIEFSADQKLARSKCPFLKYSVDMEKIQTAEKIITQSMLSPPTIKELAKKVGTNELKLKVGFKYVYGNTIYGYLIDHRMNQAKIMLEHNNIQINDVAAKVGYSNPSHFIAAFKKKFGVTPKKYLMAM